MGEVLKQMYLNPASSAYLAGANAVFREARKRDDTIRYQDVVEFLEGQDVYTRHKPVRKHFKRNRVVCDGLDSDWQADLISLPSLVEYNDDNAYILLVVDVLSKHIFAQPTVTKKPEDVRDALHTIIQRSGRQPWRLTTDRGTEFRGKAFQDYLHNARITHFCANSPDVKACNAERAIRTLKTRLFKHITHRRNFRYLDILPKLVKAINGTVSHVTKLAPKDVTYDNADLVLHRLYGTPILPVKFKYSVGEVVRISKEKHLMEKGYMPNYTREKFRIKERLPRCPVVYRLCDMHSEDIVGVFYERELSRCRT